MRGVHKHREGHGSRISRGAGAPLMGRLGRFTVRYRWWVVIGALIFVIFGGVWGAGAFGQLAGGAGFDDPNRSNRQMRSS